MFGNCSHKIHRNTTLINAEYIWNVELNGSICIYSYHFIFWLRNIINFCVQVSLGLTQG